METEDLYALQITPKDYFDYQTRTHCIESLIVADKLYDKSFLKWWICHWLEEPTIPIEQLPLCVENEIRLCPDYYTAHVKYCVNNNLLDTLRATWVPDAVPKDIMNAVKMFEINMFTVNFLLDEGFIPTEKIFLHAVMDSDIRLLQICFGHGSGARSARRTGHIQVCMPGHVQVCMPGHVQVCMPGYVRVCIPGYIQ